MKRFNWFNLHPPYHMCVECEQKRLRRSRRWPKVLLILVCLLVCIFLLAVRRPEFVRLVEIVD